MLEAIVRELRRRHPEIEIDVLSQTPAETARRYGVEATPRMNPGAVRSAIQRTDVVISGGGGLLQNATSTRSLIYYAGILRAAGRAGKRAMIFAQSVGPLNLVGRAIVRAWCGRIARATVRDERSRALLAGLLPKVPVARTADPVWMLGDVPALDFEAEGLGPGSEPLAVVSVRKIPGFERGIKTLAAAVDRLAERGAKVAFLPLGGAQDAEASTAVIRAARSAPTLLPAYDLAHATQIFSRARVAIGMRLHAVIIAARLGVPFLAVPYDPKVSALCEDLAWPLPPLWEPLRRGAVPDRADVEALVDRLWDERDSLRAELLPQSGRMRLLAGQNFDALDEILAG